MSEQKQILVVEDNPNLAEMLSDYFHAQGYGVYSTDRGEEALERVADSSTQPDLVLLDVNLTGIDGFETCRRLRQSRLGRHLPVLFLTERRERADRLAGLDLGAVDYVTKPFRVPELLARVRALLRRATGILVPEQKVRQLDMNNLSIDLDARRVKVNGEDVHLTRTEFALLAELVENLDKVLTHDELLTSVWGPEYVGTHHYLYVYLGRIREKLGEPYGNYLETVSNMGYRFATSENSASST